MTKSLIFANGEPNDGPMVRRALAEGADAVVIAADGGARVAGYFGLQVDHVIGDMDSLSAEELERLEAQGAAVQRYPVDKDATDLELALSWAAEEGINWMRVIGGVGGRTDQVLANIYLLALPVLAGCDVELVAGRQSIRLLRPGNHELQGEVGDTLSLIPVGGDVRGVSTQNLKYPLKEETLEFGPARGISNVLQSEVGHVSLSAGLLLAVHSVGKA